MYRYEASYYDTIRADVIDHYRLSSQTIGREAIDQGFLRAKRGQTNVVHFGNYCLLVQTRAGG